MPLPWSLACSACDASHDAAGLPTVCPACGAPWLVRYPKAPGVDVRAALPSLPWTMLRYRAWLPLAPEERPVTLGEGGTPLLRLPTVERALGLSSVWIKEEGQNPCGSFKARGLAMAVTRAVQGGATAFVLPTAGNAGVALAAYGARAGLPVRIYAPRTTPPTLLAQMRLFGADLLLIDGHIGDCGGAARTFAQNTGATNLSTLAEPYRVEGKKTLGLELAEQFGWSLPDVIFYPTGGGTGLIGMWKAFRELKEAGWIDAPMPRFVAVQTTGCAPVVRAFESGAEDVTAWPEPETIASGLRVPHPLGGRLMLRILRAHGGTAVAVSDAALAEASTRLNHQEGLDAAPEGGATLAALEALAKSGAVRPEEKVVLFNTGAGWLYR